MTAMARPPPPPRNPSAASGLHCLRLGAGPPSCAVAPAAERSRTGGHSQGPLAAAPRPASCGGTELFPGRLGSCASDKAVPTGRPFAPSWCCCHRYTAASIPFPRHVLWDQPATLPT